MRWLTHDITVFDLLSVKPGPLDTTYNSKVGQSNTEPPYPTFIPKLDTCISYGGFISFMHANEEYSRYDHLAPQSSKVKVGQAVSEGQEIAKVGMTGYTFHPHLHIFTLSHSWIDFDTVSVQDFIL
jgi:Peptidase family M23